MAFNLKLLCILVAVFILHIFQEVNGIGINYGLLGNDLPDPKNSVLLLKSRGITKVRLFTPDQGVLEALRGSGIEVYIGILNQDVPFLANDPSFAANWVLTNVAPYANNVIISGLAVGNEVALSPLGGYLVGAMQNLDSALGAASIMVPVTTAVGYDVMSSSYPPSQGSFTQTAAEVMDGVLRFLSFKGYPLLANIYPYYAYLGDPININLSFALLRNDSSTVMTDGILTYTNLLDAMVDAFYSALERVGAGSVKVIISQTGWPTLMGPYATIDNALQYNNNLVSLVKSGKGTPKRPQTKLEAYIFSLFNENQKAPGVENYWGLYHSNMQEVYHVNF